MHCLDKLDRLSITVPLLEETGVGRTVNSLRKFNGEVGSAAKALISKWKNHVLQSTEVSYPQGENKDSENEQKYSETTKSEDEEERLVIDTASNHKLEGNHSSHKHEKRDSDNDDKKKSTHKKDKDEKPHHHHSSSSSSSHKPKSSKSHKKDKEKDERKPSTSTSSEKDSKSHKKSDKDKGHSSKDHHKHSASSSSSSSKRKLNTSSEEPRTPKILKSEVVDSSMGFSFEDALGMSSLPSTSKGSSKPTKSSDSSKKPKQNSNSTEVGLIYFAFFVK